MKDIEHRQQELELLYARYLGGGQDASLPNQSNSSIRQRKVSPANQDWAELQKQVELAELTPEDLEIIRRLQDGQYQEVYRLLFNGAWEAAGRYRKEGRPYKTQSQADQALLNRLAKLTSGSPTRIAAIARESKLFMRDKVKDHPTYLARSIQTAIDGLGWQPLRPSKTEKGRR